MTGVAVNPLNPEPQLIDGLDIDVLAAAVRSCPGVDDLDAGQLGSAVSYLPGRKVAGLKIEANLVTVQVRIRWAVPAPVVGEQVRAALLPLVAGRRLDVVVSDIAKPPEQSPLPVSPTSTGLV